MPNELDVVTNIHLAEFIRANREPMLVEWVKRLKCEIPAASRHTFEELRDGIPLLLDSLAEALASAHAVNVTQVGTSFAAHRFQLGNYTAIAMLHEFNIMRQVVFAFLDTVKPTPDEARNRVLDVLFSVYSAAADSFGEATRRQEHDTMRQLQAERDLRERFVALLSHDLLNALMAAHANARLVARAADDAHRAVLSDRLVDAIQRAEHMARDVLDANAIHAGERLRLTLEEFDLLSLLQELVREFASTYGARFHLQGQTTTGFSSRSGLRRAAENLIQNAVKYGSENTPIKIDLCSSNEQVEISVHNEGVPLSNEEQRAVFQQFHRTVAAQKSKKKGWGLGLTLVNGIAEAHGGSVRVTSSRDAGTTFTIVLPRDARGFQPR
ncbi:MAG TPA: HAMP domain-containing sensor histidine kinase [Planctomycetota bacterium]|jgi:signal transduction histidine kinase